MCLAATLRQCHLTVTFGKPGGAFGGQLVHAMRAGHPALVVWRPAILRRQRAPTSKALLEGTLLQACIYRYTLIKNEAFTLPLIVSIIYRLEVFQYAALQLVHLRKPFV